MSTKSSLRSALESWPMLVRLEDRLSVIRAVAEYWHGPLGSVRAQELDDLRGQRLPIALAWFYRVFEGQDNVHSFYNRLARRSRLGTNRDGYIEFYTETQGVFNWATRLGDDDPPVFGRGSQDRPWILQMDRLTDFFLYAITFEALCQALWGAHGTISRQAFAHLCEPLLRIEVGHSLWENTPCSIYYGDGLTAWAWMSEGYKALSVMVGSLTEGPVRHAVAEGEWMRNWEIDSCSVSDQFAPNTRCS